MPDDFAHLHLHTQYSLLDGAIRMKDLCGTVRDRGMTSVAVTDHGNMYGAIALHRHAKEAGIKPIFGCETYVAEGDAAAKTDRKSFHLVLLAKNKVGYQNLQRLVSYAHLKGFYYQPRIDRAMLRKHSEGLIGLSACLGGHISRLVNGNEIDKARDTVKEYRSIFAPDSYFLELQASGTPLQNSTNAALAQLGRDLDVPTVATADCHYVDRHQAKAHEVLMCIGMGKTIKDEGRLAHECDELFIKTPYQMDSYFESSYPEAIANTRRIAAMCNVELDLGKTDMPEFQLPPGTEEDIPGYLRKIAREGLDRRFTELAAQGLLVDRDVYRSRLEYEIEMILRMGFPGYFLIVWDFIREAKDRRIPVGPGRGSGAGSVVAYAMRITDVDPIRWGLMFERFLNPERVSLPDFDIDFCMDRRGEVIDYVTQKYGVDHVGQITTFASLKARGLIKDVTRALAHPPAMGNDLAKLVPEGAAVTLSGAMEDPKALHAELRKNPDQKSKYEAKIKVSERGDKLRDRYKIDPTVREIVDTAMRLEGLNRHTGVHAAGIVISNKPLVEMVPCCKSEDGRIATQFDMGDVELAGLIKFDFLGLTTLTVMQRTLDQIARLPARLRTDPVSKGGPIDLAALPVDDPDVYAMIRRSETTGVFQLESSGFKNLLQRLKPDCFEDIIAAVALYRPGPMESGMVDQYVECKHGHREIKFPHPLLSEVLADTYGVFVYQEQVISTVKILAGFTAAGADIVRRAMGKKKPKEMQEQREKFIDGCATVNKIDKKLSSDIFDSIDKFSGYSFNRSHSMAYGMISYQTAWLKHYYPECFMAALMSCSGDTENVVKHIDEARSTGIEVLPPDVNDSLSDFGVAWGETGRPSIRFALSGIRDVGEGAAKEVVAGRTSRYTSLFDLCSKVGPSVNKKGLEALVRAGAFDSVSEGHDRATLLAAVPTALSIGQQDRKARAIGQGSIFDSMPAMAAVANTYPHAPPLSAKDKLQWERDALGLYLTDHPLDRYQETIAKSATCRIGEVDRHHEGREIRLVAMVTAVKEIRTKKTNASMAVLTLEDRSSKIEAVAFPKVWDAVGSLVNSIGTAPVLVIGTAKLKIDLGVEGMQIELREVRRLAEPTVEPAQAKGRHRIATMEVSDADLTEDNIAQLRRLVDHSKGNDELQLSVNVEAKYVTGLLLSTAVDVSDGFTMSIERIFPGKLNVEEIRQ